MVNGKDITLLRTLLGFHTQLEFSRAMGIAKSTISDIENDKKVITKNMMIKLVTQYGVDGSYLLTGEGEMFRNDINLTEEQRIGHRLRSIRVACKVSQNDFAKKIDSSQGVIAGIELGYKNLSRQLLVNIATNFPDISLNWLLLGTGSMYLKPESKLNDNIYKNTISSAETGRRIIDLRRALGITQKELSGIVGVTPSNLTRYETGSQGICSEVVFRICSELNVSPNWLIAGHGEIFFNDDNQKHEEVLK